MAIGTHAPDDGELVVLGDYEDYPNAVIFRDRSASAIVFNAPSGEEVHFGIGDTEELRLTASALSPGVSDGNALGTTALMWADLFLATGAVINFNNGNVTITHAAGALTSSVGLRSSGATSPLGYTTGAGGTVTQATNKTTGVTLDTVTGQITMNGAALGAAAEATFTVTNSAVAAVDTVVVHHGSAGTSGAYLAQCTAVAAGSFDITVSNVSAGSLSEAIVIHFAVIKGASA